MNVTVCAFTDLAEKQLKQTPDKWPCHNFIVQSLTEYVQ